MRLKEEMENSKNSSTQQVQMLYECEICCVAFYNLSDFQIHRIFEHSRNLGLTYAIRENVGMSYRKQDLGNACVAPNNTSKENKSEKNYECGICKRMFCILDDLCNHLEIHIRLSKNRQEGRQILPTQTRISSSPAKSSACKTVKFIAPPTFQKKLERKNQTNDGLTKRRADDSSVMEQADDKRVKRNKKRYPDQSRNKYCDVTTTDDKNTSHVLEKENRVAILNERENLNSKKIAKDATTKKDCETPEPKKCSPLQIRVVVNKARKTVPHNSTRYQIVNKIGEALNSQLKGEDAKHQSFTNNKRKNYISTAKHKLTKRAKTESPSPLTGFKSVEDDFNKTRSTGKRDFHEEDVNKTCDVSDKDETFKWCQFCNRKYSSYQKLKQHLSTVHNNNKKHMCSLCCKVFKSRYHLNRHEVVHSVVKEFHCNVCWKQFSDERKKWQHVTKRHGFSFGQIPNSKLDM